MPISAYPESCLAKIETTYKTDSTPTGVANAILLRNAPTLSPVEVDYDERDNAKAFFGNNQRLVASQKRKLSLSTEIAGSGSPLGVAAGYGPLLRSCALAQTLVATTSCTYSPITPTSAAAPESTTIYFSQGDKLYKMVGTRGNVKWNYTAGKIPLMMFDMTGLLPLSADVADDTTYGGALTFTAFKAPQVVNFANTSAFSVHSFNSSELYSMELDLGNNVVYRNKPNAEDVVIVDRKPTLTVSIGEPTLALKNFYTNMRGAVLDVLSITHGTGAGNIVNHSAPKMQIESISVGAQDNVRTLDIKGWLLPNAGNDEISMILT